MDDKSAYKSSPKDDQSSYQSSGRFQNADWSCFSLWILPKRWQITLQIIWKIPQCWLILPQSLVNNGNAEPFVEYKRDPKFLTEKEAIPEFNILSTRLTIFLCAQSLCSYPDNWQLSFASPISGYLGIRILISPAATVFYCVLDCTSPPQSVI